MSTGLITANCSRMPVIAVVEFQVNVSGLFMPVTAKVVENPVHDLILGASFMKYNQVSIDFRTKTVSMADDLVRAPLQSDNRVQKCVTCERSVCISPYSEAIISATCDRRFDNQTVILEPLTQFQFRRFALARSFSRCENGKTICQVVNYNPQALVLLRGTKLAKIEPLNVVASCKLFNEQAEPEGDNEPGTVVSQPQSNEVLEHFSEEYGFNINPKLTPDQRKELLQLLYDYKAVFARTLSEIGRYPFHQMEIELISNRKIYQRNYRMRPDEVETVLQQVAEMHEANIIEPSTNPFYNSPIFLVDKKDNTKRMIVDLRRLNANIVPMQVQLPKINELIDEILSSNCLYISTADLKSSFYQCSLAPESRPYTTFSDPEGRKWQFCSAPMGLSTSPAHLTLILLRVFAGKSRKYGIYCYLDDLLTTATTWDEHITNLKVMFQTLLDNNLTANPSKTELAFNEIEYLGFLISASGVKISPRKLKVIEAIPPPKSRKSLLRILGMANFWKKFIKNYSQNTFHMRQLLKKDVDFTWTPECQAELDFLKKSLTSDPILQPLDPNKPMVILCDAASRVGMAWQLLQQHKDGSLRIVANGGQALTPAQENWTISQLELSALAKALECYECYAIRQPVIVFSDNSQVLHWNNWRPVNARERRLIAYISQFQITVKFVRGCHNVSADCLSRIFSEMSQAARAEFMPTAQPKDDFVVSVQKEEQEEETVPVDGRSRDSWHAYQLSYESLEIGETGTSTSCSRLDPNATPYSPRYLIAETADCIADSDIRDGQFQKALPEGSDLNCAVNLDLVASDPNNENDEQLNINSLDMPLITTSDYLQDEELKHMYAYLRDGILTNDCKIDRLNILISDQYYLENDLLYRISLPRSKKVSRVQPLTQRLCVPKKYRLQLLRKYHDELGHFANERVYLTMAPLVYWKDLYKDVKDYTSTCDLCLRAKSNFSSKVAPLHPLKSASEPFSIVHLDHKNLTRRTQAGNTAILCIIDSFSSWPALIPVPDYSSYTTAKAFYENWITLYGVPKQIITDKGSAFVAAFFQHLAAFLNIRHITSASQVSRTNGLAENLIRKVAQMIKLYSTDDTKLEAVLPSIEMALRSTTHIRLKLSSYEIIFGRPMQVGGVGDLSKLPTAPLSQQQYYQWLTHRLADLHKAVNENRVESKLEIKERYDKEHKASPPRWKIGDRVLLLEKRIKPHSNVVLSHKPYSNGPFFITELVKGEEDIGTAYRLVHADTGKAFKKLVPAERLKLYTADNRVELTDRLPPGEQLANSKAAGGSSVRPGTILQPQDNVPTQDCQPAISIKKERTVKRRKEYLVLFANGETAWCDFVTPTLLEYYRCEQQAKRDRRKKKKKKGSGKTGT